jgi:hypothetical protein
MAEKTASGLIAYCQAQLGRPYWMGTFGNTASAALYQSNKKRLPQYYAAADFARQFGQRVHDCIGLIKGYLWSDGPDSAPRYLSGPLGQDLDANGMYYTCSQRGGLTTMPDTPGTLVFIFSGKKMEHIGVYIGDGQVIEARGHAYGVVQTALKGRGWTHWGLCPYITYDTTAATQAAESEGDMSPAEVKTIIKENDPVFATEDDIPAWGKSTVAKLVAKRAIQGSGTDAQGRALLNIPNSMLRVLVVNDRMGIYG